MSQLKYKSDFGVYIHWPFCQSKCPYCDFNSHVTNDVDHNNWLLSYLKEIKYQSQHTSGRTVNSVFFGGGTPTLMTAFTIEQVLNEIGNLWGFAKNAEITAEANPSSSDSKHFQDFKNAGVNRISIGVQSLDKKSLKFLGRKHSVAEAKNAVLKASNIFPRFSFDLIYGLPNQTPKAWEAELMEALKIANGHISLYQLTIERGTHFYKTKVPEAPENIGLKLYELNQQILPLANLPSYEISNYATPGQECIHNLLYWKGHDYLGVGPGAHGRITYGLETRATQNIRDPQKWLSSVANKSHGQQKITRLNYAERKNEVIMMGMRLTSGISRGDFKILTGKTFEEVLNKNKIEALGEAGFIVLNKRGLKATPSGRKRLNAVLNYLLN